MASDDIVVFGVASDGSTDQWDGHKTPTGILLRWFVPPTLNYPELGFDVFRAQVPDVPSLPFNDLNVPLLQGKPSWTYANIVTLSCPAGLHFERTSLVGWWRLLITPVAPVSVKFTSPAWLVTVRTDIGTTDLTVVGKAVGVIRKQDLLTSPTTVTWRTRGVEEIELSGEGRVSLIGYHLLGDVASWNHIAHRCLPVIDTLYPCSPQPATTEASEARSRLPAKVAAEWATRFDGPFTALLPALRRLAIGTPPAAIPPVVAVTPPIVDVQDIHLTQDERALIDLAALDPHAARILGLAYDDPLPRGLDGREYVYKVVGRWLGQTISTVLTGRLSVDLHTLENEYRMAVELGSGHRGGSHMMLRFPQAVMDASIELKVTSSIDWVANDGLGGTQAGTLSIGPNVLKLAQVLELRLAWLDPDPPVLTKLRCTLILERIGLLPGIIAVEPGSPPGPKSLTVVVMAANAPSSIATADLDWPILINPDDSLPEGEPISYQIGHRRFGSDPTSASPVAGDPASSDVLYEGAPVFISATSAQLASPRTLHTDRNGGTGLEPGWWGWWIRGVDLFGRVSYPSSWVLAPVSNSRLPPAPVLLQAEWVQRDLPATTVAVLGRSSEARSWLDSSGDDAGLVASWAFGPDEVVLCPDVDGFRLLVRRPSLPPGGSAESALEYGVSWPKAVASFGPIAIQADGIITANPVEDPLMNATVTAVQPLAPSPTAKDTDPLRSACVTNLELDGASGVLVGGSLSVGTKSYSILANGDGSGLTVVVEHAAGAAPVEGSARVQAPGGRLIELTTDLRNLTPGATLRARSGVLVVGTQRLQVLRASAGVFLCRRGEAALAKGDSAAWFPVWSAALDDTGFGPVASETTPVAHAQVAVQAVRAIRSSAVPSTPSVPLTVTAVDLTIPNTPEVDAISFDPDDSCALLASRADWYGRSRFRLSWTAQANRRFTVYRALGDEINRLDRLQHDSIARHADTFTDLADWPEGVYADAARHARVIAELATLDDARALFDPAARQTALDAAYDAMTIDTQMLLARQAYSWPAYVALFGEPIDANSYEDVLDGRSRGHWFYRVTSRTQAGIESAPSEPTPPICCLDVVPPAPPLAHMALADNERVKLRWLASPDRDTDHYEIFAASDPAVIAEVGNMTPVELYTPPSHQGGLVIEFSVPRLPGEWCFWIVAVDTSGNRSAVSRMLRGKALRSLPASPVWNQAERKPAASPAYVELTWTHSTDQRLACLVERRPITGGYWAALSGWLPRGDYTYDDTPPNLNDGWEYRLRVRDQFGQVALALPVITLEAL